MEIGLFFGSYNPIHIGHIIIANHMVEFTELEEVWFVVTPHNPFKKKSTLLADHHRYHLVQEATEDYPKLKPSNVEFGLPQPNYTINTLAHLYEKYPENHFNLIMGQDNLYTFDKWKNHEEILKNHDLYIYPRITSKKERPDLFKHSKVHLIDAPVVEVSATFIRKSIAGKKNIRALLPDKAWKYLDEMNFYK
jgi:nicotinate-nucleotide adenylyltransferase